MTAFFSKNKIALCVLVYSFCLVFIPGIPLGPKRVFPTEILLLPLFFWALWKDKLVNIPRPLVCLWIALIAAFISGSMRGGIANTFNFYTIFHDDFFDWKQELIRLVRWSLVFASPWFIYRSLQDHVSKSEAQYGLTLFLKSTSAFGAVSGLALILDSFKLINLSAFGFFETNTEWANRAIGTFTGPQEAGLFFGLLILMDVMGLGFKNKFLRMGFIFIFAFAVYLTRNGTAAMSLIGALAIPSLIFKSEKRKYLWILAAVIALGLLIVVPSDLLQHKWSNFTYRAQIWFRWLEVIRDNPRILFFGLGFAKAVTDNSFFFLLIKLGLVGTAAFTWWFIPIIKKVPQQYSSLAIYWICSWIALDSLGFWAIGRFFWLFLGIFWITHEPNANKTKKL